ncbi:porin family protein [Vibrio agarivorans]|uniref:porin family protein n=1 Tax=Vibrio agarivorans TaxID=153622 RepID=UPI002230B208|nr:porin family protein [Vibrio agarivorans]MDN3660348.1 porin family protein [Vibrio agarivorans]
MKKLILASTLALMSASSFAADDHTGFRVGGGLGSSVAKFDVPGAELVNDKADREVEADPSLVIEAGYDFNKIFAVNVKGAGSGFKTYEKGSNKGLKSGTAYEISLEGEAGYTFVTDGGAAIKPYAAIGGVYYDKDSSKVFGLTDKDKGAVKARGAVGVRMTLDNGVYFDGRVQATDFSQKGKSFKAKDDLMTQGLLTVGYKF